MSGSRERQTDRDRQTDRQTWGWGWVGWQDRQIQVLSPRQAFGDVMTEEERDAAE